MKLRGNKGEWSELYVLLRLLAYKKLFAANEKVQRLEDVYFPVLKVFRNESESKRIEYNLMDEQIVDVYINDEKVRKFGIQCFIGSYRCAWLRAPCCACIGQD